MGTVIYNLDKVVREKCEVQLGGVKYEVREPSVSEFALIQRIDFDSELSHEELLRIMCPTVNLDLLTKRQLIMLVQVCFKVMSGENGKKKLLVEDLME
ncbi:MAG: hypothetical protein ACRC6E_09335 [Fusobacteriaceae bacterium]